MPQKIFVTRTDWIAVSRIVSEKLGRKYPSSYCREVARGVRNSAPLEKELRAMNLMEAAPKTPQRVAA